MMIGDDPKKIVDTMWGETTPGRREKPRCASRDSVSFEWVAAIVEPLAPETLGEMGGQSGHPWPFV